jgi:PKHD-type hydroxylase
MQLESVRTIMRNAHFVDGRHSAGMVARRVKRNEEMDLDEETLKLLNNLVMGSLVQNPLYRSATLPLRVAAPHYARYTAGMSYGNHVDDPIMGTEHRYRSDISVTIFLNDPQDYDGGELVIRTSFGDRSIKLPAGDAIVYPSSSIHRVSEVTRGERLVAVSWIQSLVRDADKRALLHDLNQAREKLLREAPDAAETTQVDSAYVNLVRMWAEV